jgi:hypothetical protein
MFKLPGTQPPEKEIFASVSVREYLRDAYSIDLNDFTASLSGENHHRWFTLLAEHVSQDKAAIVTETAKACVSGLPESEISALIEPLGQVPIFL